MEDLVEPIRPMSTPRTSQEEKFGLNLYGFERSYPNPSPTHQYADSLLESSAVGQIQVLNTYTIFDDKNSEHGIFDPEAPSYSSYNNDPGSNLLSSQAGAEFIPQYSLDDRRPPSKASTADSDKERKMHSENFNANFDDVKSFNNKEDETMDKASPILDPDVFLNFGEDSSQGQQNYDSDMDYMPPENIKEYHYGITSPVIHNVEPITVNSVHFSFTADKEKSIINKNRVNQPSINEIRSLPVFSNALRPVWVPLDLESSKLQQTQPQLLGGYFNFLSPKLEIGRNLSGFSPFLSPFIDHFTTRFLSYKPPDPPILSFSSLRKDEFKIPNKQYNSRMNCDPVDLNKKNDGLKAIQIDSRVNPPQQFYSGRDRKKTPEDGEQTTPAKEEHETPKSTRRIPNPLKNQFGTRFGQMLRDLVKYLNLAPDKRGQDSSLSYIHDLFGNEEEGLLGSEGFKTYIMKYNEEFKNDRNHNYTKGKVYNFI